MYEVLFSKAALKQLKKLDRHISLFIISWIRKHLQGCENPYATGKALTANRTGQWRYRIGDFRLIAEINEETIIILILNIGHRKDVYRH